MELKEYLNSLKCPICNSQIDLLPSKHYLEILNFNYSCVSDAEHYALRIDNNYSSFVQGLVSKNKIKMQSLLVKEQVIVYSGKYKFIVTKKHNTLMPHLTISSIVVDPERRVVDNINIKISNFDINYIDFVNANANEEKILSKIKTLLVFQ